MTSTVIVDRNGVVTAWNGEAEQLLGYPAAEAVGRAMDFFIPQEHHAAHWSGFRGAMASGRLKFGPSDVLPVEAIRRDGARIPIDVVVVAQRDDSDRITALTATIKLAGPR